MQPSLIYKYQAPSQFDVVRININNILKYMYIFNHFPFLPEILLSCVRIYTVISWINFIFIFSSGLEIFFTFNIHHPVYGFQLFNLTNPLLITIVLAGPVRPTDKRHLAEKKVSSHLKKIFKNPTVPFYIGDGN